MSNAIPGVSSKVQQLQAAIKEISKGGRNEKQRYDFRTIDDVLSTYKVVMDRIGLLCYPELQEFVCPPIIEDKKVRVFVKATYAFCDPSDGSKLYVQALGEGVDFGGDKATYKALTGAQKYALTQALVMPCDGYDPERTDFEEGPKGR